MEGEAVAVIRVNNHFAGICAFRGTEWQETAAVERAFACILSLRLER